MANEIDLDLDLCPIDFDLIDEYLNNKKTFSRGTSNTATIGLFQSNNKCLCNLPLYNICEKCGCVSNEIIFENNKITKKKVFYCPKKYLFKLLNMLKYIKPMQYKDIHSLRDLKKIEKENYMNIFASQTNAMIDDQILETIKISQITTKFLYLKKQFKWSSRIMFLKYFEPQIYEHYKDFLPEIKNDKIQKKYLDKYNDFISNK